MNNKEELKITKDFLQDIFDLNSKEYVQICRILTSTDNDAYFEDIVLYRIKDQKYFKFEFCNCEHLHWTSENLNTFPIIAKQVYQKIINCIIYE